MKIDNPTITALLKGVSARHWRKVMTTKGTDLVLIRQLTDIQEDRGNYIKAGIARTKQETELLYGSKGSKGKG